MSCFQLTSSLESKFEEDYQEYPENPKFMVSELTTCSDSTSELEQKTSIRISAKFDASSAVTVSEVPKYQRIIESSKYKIIDYIFETLSFYFSNDWTIDLISDIWNEITYDTENSTWRLTVYNYNDPLIDFCESDSCNEFNTCAYLHHSSKPRTICHCLSGVLETVSNPLDLPQCTEKENEPNMPCPDRKIKTS